MRTHGKSSWNPVWEEVFKEQGWGMYPDPNVIRFIARNFYNVSDRKQIKVLDVGAGTGANSWFVAREGFDAYAIDGSKEGMRVFNERLQTENLTAHTAVGDVINLPYESQTFDALIDGLCVCHNSLENMKRIISEEYRVLKSGGKMLAMLFGTGTYLGENPDEIEPNTFVNVQAGILTGKGLFHLTTEDEILELYAQFSDIKIDKVLRTDNQQQYEEFLVTLTK